MKFSLDATAIKDVRAQVSYSGELYLRLEYGNEIEELKGFGKKTHRLTIGNNEFITLVSRGYEFDITPNTLPPEKLALEINNWIKQVNNSWGENFQLEIKNSTIEIERRTLYGVIRFFWWRMQFHISSFLLDVWNGND